MTRFYGVPLRNSLGLGLGGVISLGGAYDPDFVYDNLELEDGADILLEDGGLILLEGLMPTLWLDFQYSTSLDSRITFTRASTATYFNNLGVLTTAGSGVPRFDYNPSTLQPRGLLIEEQRTNSLLQSQTFQTTWATSQASISADATTAPDGTTTADALVENTAANFHFVSQTVSGTTNTNNYTMSCFIKASTRTAARIAIIEGTTFSRQVRATVDLSNGTVVGAALNSATLTAATVQPVGNNWYRVTVTGVLGGTDTNIFCAVYVGQDPSTFNYTGNGTSGIFIWGAQLEAGAFATSYIPTTTTALTRNADVATMTGTNFSSWYNASEGTLFAQWSKIGSLNFQSMFGVSDNTTSNVIIMAHGSGAPTNNARFDVNVSGSSQASLTMITGSAVNTVYKTVGAYKANDFAAVAGGGAVQTDATGTIPTVTQAVIGTNGAANGGFFCGHIQRIAYYPTRLPNATLQVLTT